MQELYVWQPRRLIKFLSREVEPFTDQNYTMEIFTKDPNGENSEEPIFSGRGRVLTAREISKFYDKLGSFLHSPTIAQIQSGTTNTLDKMESACEDLMVVIEEVLESTLFSSQSIETHTIKCHRCKKPVICYVPIGSLPKQLEVKCNSCNLEFDVKIDEEGISLFTPIVCVGDCVCGKKLAVYRSDFKEGETVECEDCHTKFEFKMQAVVIE